MDGTSPLREKPMTLQINSLTPLIEVFDMPTSVRFYCDGLGFEIIEQAAEVDAPEGRHFQWARLRLGPAQLMLNTAHDVGERPAEPDPAREAAHRDTYFFFGCGNVDAVAEMLRAAGIACDDPIDQNYGMRQVYLRDPDGYQLCFQQRK
jgi:glyoxylase I family protein